VDGTAVILVALPRLAGDLLAALIRAEPDLRLLGTVPDAAAARRLARGAAGRVTIVAGEGFSDRDVIATLLALPRSRVVVFDRLAQAGRACELETRCRALPVASPAALLAAIRRPLRAEEAPA
jgi:hypothetical protein